jgi:hypothetical protein
MVMTDGISTHLTNDEIKSASDRPTPRASDRPGLHSGYTTAWKVTDGAPGEVRDFRIQR